MFANNYWLVDRAVPAKVCKAILEDIDWSKSEKGTIRDVPTNSAVENENIRITDVVWHDKTDMGSILSGAFLNAGNEGGGWNFLLNTLEMTQIGRYTEKGHYDWHTDASVKTDTQNCRKLTSVILLNDPSEFEGGKLEIRSVSADTVYSIDMQCGSVVVFPSFLMHRVTPVTKGVRYTAVCWASGPLLR